MKEEWKLIDGYEKYFISNFGRLYSSKTEKILKPRYTRDGYIYYLLSEHSRQKGHRVHRLVAQAFIPNPNNLDTVNHIDGDKHNNHVSNLEWMDRHSQIQHAYDLGLKKPMRSTNNARSKCTKEQVLYIREKYDNHTGSLYGFFADLSRELGLSQTIVERVARRKTYFDI